MRKQFILLIFMVLLLAACSSPNQRVQGLTPIPTLAGGAALTPVVSVVPASGAEQGGQESDSTGSQAVSQQPVAAVGAALYTRNCSPCHGNEGQGVDAPALRNNNFVQSGSPDSLYGIVADGLPGSEMPAWLHSNGGPLTSAQISDTVAYLKSLQNVSPLPSQPPPPEEPAETQPPPGGPTPEPARPSNSGGPGAAAAQFGDPDQGRQEFGLYCAACHGPQGVQGIPNPGSDDGSVPELNPIDPTIVSSDPKVFSENLDLFIEHGSVPEGSAPWLVMPAFGDQNLLADQQISDLIAYVMQLNGVSTGQ